MTTSLLVNGVLASAYEVARSRFQVDVTQLAMLTNFNINGRTKAALAAEPERLATLMGHEYWYVK